MNATEIRSDWGALFDLDGVLIDSEGTYTMFWHDIDVRYPTGVDRFEHVIKGSTLTNILDTYFPDEEVRRDILRELKAHETAMEYIPFDGVEDFLRTLHASGVRSAIVTSSSKAKMRHLAGQLPELMSLVDVVVTGDDVSRSKPHPEGYRTAAARIGVPPSRCVVFEDSMAGVEAGRRAGGAVVGVTGTNTAEMLARFADIVVDAVASVDLHRLVALLPD